MIPLNILVACEYSGIVSQAFSKLGHNVTSCDLLPSSSHHQHYIGDVRDLLHLDWDLIIAFPPCTYLCKAQFQLLANEKGRFEKMANAAILVRDIYNAPCNHIAIENPIGILPRIFRKYDQLTHPYLFGDPWRKDICLWLKNLPKLSPVSYQPIRKHRVNQVNSRMTQAQKSHIKSLFYPDLAEQMALQWSRYFELGCPPLQLAL